MLLFFLGFLRSSHGLFEKKIFLGALVDRRN